MQQKTGITPMQKNLILDKSFGCYRAYAATVDNAVKIMKDSGDSWMSAVVKDIVDNDAKYVSREAILKVISKILTMPVGDMASKTIQITEEIRQEIVLYCFKHNISIKHPGEIDSTAFFKVFKLSDFSFFASNEHYNTAKGIAYLYEMELAGSYKTITKGAWSEKATDRAKINFILDFVKQISHRDVEYELIEYAESV